MTFLDVFWSMLVAFALLAYLMVMFAVITDLFRDHETSGVKKAVWVTCLILFPLLTSLVYLVSRGDGMARRNLARVQAAQAAQEDYVRSLASPVPPADQIATAKALLDAGTISQEEFDSLKARALA